MNLTTNGTFPTKIPFENIVDKLLPVISDVKFSLNGINAEVNESIMCGAKTERQLNNIRYWIQRRDELGLKGKSTVTLQVTFMRSNLNELIHLVQWGIENRVDRIKGHHVWKTSEEIDHEQLRCADYMEEWNQVVEQCHSIAQGKITLVNFTPITSLDKINTNDTVCPFLGRELWVEYDGSYQICCCPSDMRADFGNFSSALETELLDMWNSSRYADFVAGWGSHENCKKCNMRIKR